jgi:glycosyltransferase involved in cell wall biosynthesis
MLVLAGCGDPVLVAQLKRDAVRLGIDSDVVWAGFLTGENKWTALSDADVFVLPSYSENFGISPVEAMACGCPVVLSDQVGIHQQVVQAGAGLATPCRVEEFSKALLEVLTNDGLRRRMSENGVQLARQQFSLDAIGRKLVETYVAVIS